MFCFYPRQTLKKKGVSKNGGTKDYRFGHRVKKVNYLSKQRSGQSIRLVGLMDFPRLEDEFLTWKSCEVNKVREIFQRFFGTEKFVISIRHSPSWHLSSVKGLDSKSSFFGGCVCCLFFQKVGRNGIGKIKVTKLFFVIFGLARWKWESYSYLNKSTYIKNILKDKVSIYSTRSCTRMQHEEFWVSSVEKRWDNETFGYSCTPRKMNMEPQTWGFGRWFSFSTGWFLGSMFIFRGVV